MNDLISRQEAKEVLNKLARDNFTLNDAFSFYLGALHDAADGIEALPSAQPDVPDTNVGDTIFRQAAIDEMKNMYEAAEKWGREATDDVIKARAESCMASLIEMKLRIEKLPSAQPDPLQIAKDIATIIENEQDMRVIRSALDESNTHNTLEALEQRWIPCSERLPEEEEKCYWVCTDTGYQCQCRWTNNVFGIRDSDRWGWKIFDIPQYTHVVAWMSLPEQYREDGDWDG